MLKRKIYDEFLEWKGRKHKCLVVSGQRQVGKSYIIREFAKVEYDYCLEINFNDDRGAHLLFEGDIDADSVIEKLSLHYGVKLVPGRTLIFMDEIQECPRAYSSLKSFSIDGRYDVIASGSLLGVNIPNLDKKEGEIDPLIPLGYEERISMHALDFEEFLWAMDVSDEAVAKVRSSIKNKTPIDVAYLNRFGSLFRDYMIIGGMPEAVQTYVDTKDYSSAGKVIDGVISTCHKDMNRYNSGIDKVKTAECFDSMPDQLASTNKKFMYSRISGGKSRKSSDMYMENLLWIKGAGYANFCYGLEQPTMPLAGNTKRDSFRIYMSDTGMLLHMYGESAMRAVFEGNSSHNMGAIAENVVAECLTKCGYELRYYEKRKGENKMELDFVIDDGTGVVAIEVKSGKDRSAPSIEKLPKVFKVGRRVMLENGNISVDADGVEHYPLFSAAFFRDTDPEWDGPRF